LGIGLLLLNFSSVASAALAARVPNNLTQMFDYDSHQLLDIHDTTVKDFDCGVIHDITYASPSGGLVSAYQIVPKGKGPFAAMIFGHWGNGTRGEFIPEAKAYACAGVVSLLPDYRWERTRPWYAAIDDFAIPPMTVHRTRALGRTVNLCFEKLGAETVFVDAPSSSGRTI